MITEIKLIQAILEEFNNLNEKDFYPDAKLLDILGWSSLNILILRAKIQDEFNVKLSDIEIKECITIHDLFSKIISK